MHPILESTRRFFNIVTYENDDDGGGDGMFDALTLCSCCATVYSACAVIIFPFIDISGGCETSLSTVMFITISRRPTFFYHHANYSNAQHFCDYSINGEISFPFEYRKRSDVSPLYAPLLR